MTQPDLPGPAHRPIVIPIAQPRSAIAQVERRSAIAPSQPPGSGDHVTTAR